MSLPAPKVRPSSYTTGNGWHPLRCQMTAGPVKSPAVSMWQALGCTCPRWGAASWVPRAWRVLPDVQMCRPATSLLFNRPLCKPHQTVVRVTHTASCGCDAECGLGFLFVWVYSSLCKQCGVSACEIIFLSPWLDREGRERGIFLPAPFVAQGLPQVSRSYLSTWAP